MSYEEYLKACMDGSIDVIESMIKNKSIYSFTFLGWGFGYACRGGHLNIINLMIKEGFDEWDEGLHGACWGGHLNIIELMIEKGANDWNDGLSGACEGGHLNIIELMIEKGANNLNIGLHGACEGGNLTIIKLMIEKGANNWNDGLKGACRGGHSDIIRSMIEKGADNWSYLFDDFFVLIDSDIVKLIIEKNISIKPYLQYPRNRKEILRLHELGLTIEHFKDIDGYNDLMEKIKGKRNVVKHILSDNLINDLIDIVNEYVTYQTEILST